MYNNQQNVINLFSNISNINEITFRFDSKYYPFKIEDFEEKYIIDSTANNDVKLTHHKPTGNFMAVKYVNIPIRRKKLENDNTAHYLIQEVELHKSLRHSHYVVTFYGLCLHQNKALICMELMDFSLYYFYELIHELNWKVPEDFLGCIVYCILNALADCKAKDIIHRDVKPGNILLNRKGEIKLCDFGVSRILNDSMATTVIGTMRYWPPEHFTQIRQPFDVRADIWSLGMTLAEVTLGGFPLSENDAIHRDFALLQNLILETNMQLLIDQIYINYSSNVKEFVKLCLLERDKRPKYDQLMQTTFYNDYDDLNLPVYMVKLIRIVEDATKVKNTPDNIGKIQLLNNELEAIAIQKNNKKFSPKLLPFGNTWDTCPVTQLHDTYTIYNPIPTTPHQNTIDDETELVIECKGLMECRRIVMSLMKSERFKSTMDRIKEMRPIVDTLRAQELQQINFESKRLMELKSLKSIMENLKEINRLKLVNKNFDTFFAQKLQLINLFTKNEEHSKQYVTSKYAKKSNRRVYQKMIPKSINGLEKKNKKILLRDHRINQPR